MPTVSVAAESCITNERNQTISQAGSEGLQLTVVLNLLEFLAFPRLI